ncbi:probable tetraacyldisaccharide 4'-kinase, mitochondrial [Impatiens glandulifera]|uniref:probable tetraacyldisaccharide 4'-kinase, mitochondrial n=1 Tax=Impatiens glandulifera TaxID=253017 RepID=UPI001FB116F8|nr:probable tetraacyldisaccharide 4'-kinase, mitochondrial [Impatiens glandulifera]
MEKLRTLVNQIAHTQSSKRRSTLSPLQLSLIPFLSFASSVYGHALSIRHSLYDLGLFRRYRLPVPVISIGNLTWGGNGKTPMVEFISHWLVESGVTPLILTRGYANGDEAKMLERHFSGTCVKIGIGANRAATAASFIERHGFVDPYKTSLLMGCSPKDRDVLELDRVGMIVLDDGMQHLSLERDLEIVMVNAMIPWGNGKLIPLGPLREPLTAIRRADVAVVHHADLASEQDIEFIEKMLQGLKESLPVFFTKMSPCFFFIAGNTKRILPLNSLHLKVILCVSAIGFADAFKLTIKKIDPLHVDELYFSDHHLFEAEDIRVIIERLENLHAQFHSPPVVVVTEKDYDREPGILQHLHPFEVLVLCSELQFISRKGSTSENYKALLKQLLKARLLHQ